MSVLDELEKKIALKAVEGLDLSGRVLEGIDFSGCRISKVNFKKCELVGCRFRGAVIEWCDFRYVKVQDGTFEDCSISFCDFYRAFFDGVVIFNGARLSNSSINKAYFGDSALIKKENLEGGRILQQDEKAYRKFLKDWHTMGTGERSNDVGAFSDWSPDAALKGRWAECETIFKNFSAQWTGRGYIADGNWAYVRGRKMERKRMWAELSGSKLSFGAKLRNLWKIFLNLLSDLFFGYGESMLRMILTYFVAVFLFAWIFCSKVSLLEYGQALGISLKNMVGMDSDLLHDVSPLVDMLNIVQTTVGIVLTGIFGFILGNKIRNQ